LFSRFSSLKGWDIREIAVFYGMISVSFAVSEGFSRGFDMFADQVITGEFDRSLLRPRTTFLQVLAHDFQLMRVGRMTQGVVVLIWGLANLAIAWTPAKAILLAGSIIGGVMVFAGLMIMQATMCFWSTQSLEVMNSFTYGGVETAQWPIPIYSHWFAKIFIFVIPLACVNYFPVMAILDKADPLGSPAWLGWVSPLAGTIFFATSLLIWRMGVRHYRSTGS
jgi:ABC-2 type transport system permease protein